MELNKPQAKPTSNSETIEFIDWLNTYLSEHKKNKALKFQNEIFLLYLKLKSVQKVSEFLKIEINVIKKSVRNYTQIIENEYENRNI